MHHAKIRVSGEQRTMAERRSRGLPRRRSACASCENPSERSAARSGEQRTMAERRSRGLPRRRSAINKDEVASGQNFKNKDSISG